MAVLKSKSPISPMPILSGAEEKDFSRQLPPIVRAGDGGAAVALAIKAALPERLALLNMQGLDAATYGALCRAAGIGFAEIAPVYARIGRLGFSFPLWRFVMQSAEGAPSLAERFGMTRLSRPTDLRDASLPDPDRDGFGVGFSVSLEGYYIEFRRAYLICADLRRHHALVIRNSSWYFGRDRLPWAFAFCRAALDAEALAAFDAQKAALFQPALDEGSARDMEPLLERLEAVDMDFNLWLRAGAGLAHLREFLARAAGGRAQPWLCAIDSHLPPWFPRPVSLDENGLQGIGAQDRHVRLALLSGQNGDWPAR